MSSRVRSLVLALLTGGLIAAGCGGDSTTTTTPAGADEFVKKASIAVSAPTSLDRPFNDYALDQNLTTQMSFSGANVLAGGLRSSNVPPDLFVADSEALVEQARDDGLVSEPVSFATDELVLAVPKDSKITSVDDLTAEGVTIAIGEEGLPVGDYAREAIAELPRAQSKALLANAAIEGANNNDIVAIVTKGDADAGLVYATDVKVNAGKLKAIELPAGARPKIVYAGAVVPEGENPPGGQHFLDAMLDGKGAALLEQYGFGPPPG